MASAESLNGNAATSINKSRQRNGPRSCYECRRRKIRCIPRGDKPSICSECYARGSECLSQEQAQAVIVTNRRRNLRERVTRVEGLLETMRKEFVEHRKLMETFRSARSINSPQRTDVATFFEFPVDSNKPFAPMTLDFTRNAINSKDVKVLQELKSSLPKGEQLQSAMEKSNASWIHRCRHHRGSRKQFSFFKDFASHAFSQGSPYEAAEVIQILASTSESAIFDQVLQVIDRVIICDDDYILSLQGLQCALSQGFLYSEAGQALRAWQTWRRAITAAQVLGLHKERRSLEADKIWWMLYNLDRFFSLLLGVPYAIADVHCNMDYRGRSVDNAMTCSGFVIRLSRMTGKVIDHLQDCNGSVPTTSVDDLSRELAHIATEMPGDFWDIGAVLTKDDMSKAMQWMEKIMGHLAYYQTDIALHLPYMLKSAKQPRLKPLRDHCIQSSRKFLRSYHQLRHSSSVFKDQCRHVDSVGCTACIVLLLSLWGYANSTGNNSSLQDVNDRELVRVTMEILKRSSNEMCERVGLQSYRALQRLTQSQNMEIEPDSNSEAKFTIPFLGKSCVTRRDFFPEARPPTFAPLPHLTLMPNPSIAAVSNPLWSPVNVSETQQLESLLWSRYDSIGAEPTINNEWLGDFFGINGSFGFENGADLRGDDLELNTFLGQDLGHDSFC